MKRVSFQHHTENGAAPGRIRRKRVVQPGPAPHDRRGRILRAFWTFALLLLVAVPRHLHSATLEYEVKPYGNPSHWYSAVHLADIDGDGRKDVIIGNRSLLRIEIWKPDSFGNLSLVRSIPVSCHVHDIASGDLDKNGSIDLVFTTRGCGLYRSMALGTPILIAGGYGWQLLLNHFDLDGNLDLFHGFDGWNSRVFYGDGTGGFPVSSLVPGLDRGMGFNAIDVDRDGFLDLVGGDWNSNHGLMVYRNGGSSRTWTQLGPFAPVGLMTSRISPSAADLNGDGFIDFVAYRNTDILRFSGGPGPTWGAPTIVDTLPHSITPVGVADLNDDGRLDVFAGHHAAAAGFTAYLGDGAGNLTKVPVILSDAFGYADGNGFALADLDGNGTSDIVTIPYQVGVPDTSRGFAVLLRRPDNRPPSADAGPDQTVECAGPTGTPVTLNGSGSTDPDGDPLTFEWKDEAGRVVGAAAVIQVNMPLVSHAFTLKVDDGKGGTASDTVAVTVRDTIAPAIHVALAPKVLWPPNHQLVPVTATIQASDVCTPPAISLVSVTSSEPDNGLGDGDTANDVQNADLGADDRTLLLRAERSANGNGRTYTATYQATDSSGNSATAAALVTVPKNQGKN